MQRTSAAVFEKQKHDTNAVQFGVFFRSFLTKTSNEPEPKATKSSKEKQLSYTPPTTLKAPKKSQPLVSRQLDDELMQGPGAEHKEAPSACRCHSSNQKGF